MKIGIAGAGIGGLAAAALLARDGHQVTVFDQFSAPRPVGSGLVIQPVGQEVLRAAQAWDSASAAGHAVWHMLGHEARSGRRVLDVSYGPHGGDSYGLAIHRAALFDALLDAARRAGAHLIPSARVTGRHGQSFTLNTSGQSDPFDLLVDASGAGSPLSPLRARALPFGAIWATVPVPQGPPLPPHSLRQTYRRADRMLGVMPIGQVPGQTGDHAAIFWSLPRGGYEAWRAAGLTAWQEEARDLWPDFAPYAAAITDPDQMTPTDYTHGTLRRPYADGLVHIGDAAHRASPQLGQGANMALLDARALQLALRRAPVAQALPLYARARRWHVWTYQMMSAAFTPQYQSHSRVLPLLRDRLLFPVSTLPPLPRLLTRLVRGDMLPPLGPLQKDAR